MKIIKLTETQIKSVIKKVVEESHTEENYMFFSNLEQIEEQCKLLRQLDKSTIDELLSNGNDWADDHITEAKLLIDQAFDFIINETRGQTQTDKPVDVDVNQTNPRKTFVEFGS